MKERLAISPASIEQLGPNSDLKGYSCLTCRQRKVKCDRHAPCSNCVKADKQCSFIPPVRGKRKRSKLPRESLHAKLRRYEELLKSYGAKVDALEDDNDSEYEMVSQTGKTSQVDAEMDEDIDVRTYNRDDPFGLQHTQPKIIIKGDTSRYFDSYLWTNLGDKWRHPEAGVTGEPTDESVVHDNDMILEHEPGFTHDDLANLHPSSGIIQKLKDIFTDRIDPVMKILHLPTFWLTFSHALQKPRDLPTNLEALIFAFYLTTTKSMKEDECHNLFGEPQLAVSSRFRRATRQALLNAEFLSTCSLMTLQAYSMYIQCVRDSYRCDTMFALSGVAIRLARKMGLHRDGTHLGLPPFEAEMRRRLWWHLIHMDFRLAEVMGTKPSLDLSCTDTRVPLNVNDEDLTPGMVELPPERIGITTITLCWLRCEIMRVISKLISSSPGDMSWEVLYGSIIPLATKDDVIHQIEDYFETKLLRYCDPSNPFHTLVSFNVRAAVCKMKLIAHDPRQFTKVSAKVPQEERNIVFENAVKLLEYFTLMQGNQSLAKYLWHMGTSYLWNTLLYILIEIRHRRRGPDVGKAWNSIEKVFSGISQKIEGSALGVYRVMGKWTLEAWDDYLVALRSEGHVEPVTPDYINTFRRLQIPSDKPQSRSKDVATNFGSDSHIPFDPSNMKFQEYDESITDFETIGLWDFPNLPSFEMDSEEWTQWEQLFADQGRFYSTQQ